MHAVLSVLNTIAKAVVLLMIIVGVLTLLGVAVAVATGH